MHHFLQGPLSPQIPHKAWWPGNYKYLDSTVFLLLLHLLPVEEKAIKKEKARVKAFSSRNNSSVKIYPDIIKREMHVVAKENEGKNVDFFVFDLQGTLMQNYKLKAKDHFRISGLTKGTYVYRVFCGDEETASGKFEIR